MQRLPGSLAVASTLLFALYACGSGGIDEPAAADTGEDAASEDAEEPRADGHVEEGAPDGASDASTAATDATLDAPIDVKDAAGDADAAVPAPPALRFLGRRDSTDPLKPKFAWPGGRIIARFTGTEMKVTLDEQSLFEGPSRWDVLVDGALSSTLTPAAGVGTYTIAMQLDANMEHVVELYRRTEAQVGVTQLLGYELTNGGKLLSPPPPPPRRVEFLGDSTTNGYGNECTASSQTFSGATQNERLAFSGLVARDLDADHHDLSYSGKGVLFNYIRSDTVVFEQLFPRALPASAAPLWSFTGFTPDVVWITLGGNDWDQETAATPPPDVAAFTAKYVDLAALVRAKYPAAHVFCAIAPTLKDDFPVGWAALTSMRNAVASVVSTRAAAGDAKIYAYEFTRAIYPTDVTGCAFHGNLALHRKMADEVIVQVKAKTGWP